MSKTIHKGWRKIATASLFALALIIAPLSGTQLVGAAAGEAVWTGAAGDSKFSSAGNWEGNTLPTAGDVLVFNTAPVIPQGQFSQTIDNDLNLVFGGLKSELQGWSSSDAYNFTKKLRLIENPVLVRNGPAVYTYTAGVTIEGDFTVTLANQSVVTITEVQGTLTLASGVSERLWDNGPIAEAYVIQKGAKSICTSLFFGSMTVTAPVTLGGGTGDTPQITPTCGAGGGAEPSSNVLTFKNITLLADAEVGVNAPFSVVIEQLTSNGFSVVRPQAATGTLSLPGGEVIENGAKTTNIDGDQSSVGVILVEKETGILNGTRDYINVGSGAVLKGQGTVNHMYVNSGVVSPGNSPGTITVLQSLNLSAGATYVAELLNVNSYDQLIAGENYAETSNAVSIGGSTLNTILFEGWSINQGDSFTIIDNRSATQVSGEFNDLPEGTQFTVDGIVFSISYVGGDGNDVVITALNEGTDPDAPNTGAGQVVLANPGILAGLGIVTAGFLVFLATRRKTTK